MSQVHDDHVFLPVPTCAEKKKTHYQILDVKSDCLEFETQSVFYTSPRELDPDVNPFDKRDTGKTF